ncbi:YaaL family protein [Lacticaseibacillus jixianensis]|uniref:YaaL family protein n=1 Tax=Lacticaseibacillus jixianensis TaxID=2486012 RepID=A0ABW4B8X1_9LACO|nr:YaaL family protein [Lacticaseibacillus jixianensis]
MFFRKRKPSIKNEADRALMEEIYQVRDRMASQRKLMASFREVDEVTKAQLDLQKALFDFLHREARERHVAGEIVAEMAAISIEQNQ